VGVHLDDANVLVFRRDLLEGRREGLAGPAPRRPEVDDDDVVHGDGLVELLGDQLADCHSASSTRGTLYAFCGRAVAKPRPGDAEAHPRRPAVPTIPDCRGAPGAPEETPCRPDRTPIARTSTATRRTTCRSHRFP